eukprot:COSAG02_NODE_49_length_45106_cov_298.436177_20_plen_65_part_00
MKQFNLVMVHYICKLRYGNCQTNAAIEYDSLAQTGSMHSLYPTTSDHKVENHSQTNPDTDDFFM